MSVYTAPAPAIAHAAPAPVVELVNPAPAATYAAPAPVVDCLTPAHIEAHDAPADVDEGIVSCARRDLRGVGSSGRPANADEIDAPAPAATCAAPALVDVVRARVTEHVAPMPLDTHDAALMGILNDFHQCVQRIPDPPPHPNDDTDCVRDALLRVLRPPRPLLARVARLVRDVPCRFCLCALGDARWAS